MLRCFSPRLGDPSAVGFLSRQFVRVSAMIPDPDKTASIHLDYGADSADFDVQDLHVCRQGLRIKTRWYFEPGAELSVNFQLNDDSARRRILRTEGVVADCSRLEDGGGFLVTVVFLEVTDDILAVIRDVAESMEFS